MNELLALTPALHCSLRQSQLYSFQIVA